MTEELRNKDGLTEKEFLATYRPSNYERPSVTVDMLLFGINKSLNCFRLLLIQRGNHPFMNCWALPGGFVDIKESAYEAACRELYEETGLENIYMEQLYTFTKPDRDPRMRVIDIAYMALLPETDVKGADDAKDAAWFDVTLTEDELFLENTERHVRISYRLECKCFQNGVVVSENPVPRLTSKDALAFDHSEIVLEGLLRLRNKVRYTDIAFNLMGAEFALSDLQRVYEIILGHPLQKKAFRDHVEQRVTERGEGYSITGNRKCKLYRYERKNREKEDI